MQRTALHSTCTQQHCHRYTNRTYCNTQCNAPCNTITVHTTLQHYNTFYYVQGGYRCCVAFLVGVRSVMSLSYLNYRHKLVTLVKPSNSDKPNAPKSRET